ncbi:MAG: radical SAM protein [Promethearchaeota archaeon]
MQCNFKWLDFKITNRCNNHCVYCGISQDPVSADENLTPKIIKETLSDALELGFTHFAFLGGEPSLRNDFSKFLIPLQGNKVYNTRSKHAQVVASIDNLENRNYKHQDPLKVMEIIKKIKDISNEYAILGVRELHVHSVVSRENFHSLIRHVKYFLSLGIEVSLALVEPHFIVSNPRHYNEFTREEIYKVLEQLDTLESEGILNWANHVFRDYIVSHVLESTRQIEQCTAGSEHVIIDSDGAVYPCLTEAYRKGLSYGNIRDKRFIEIYYKMQGFHCESPFKQTCWDHYLWTRLGKLMKGDY